MPDGESNEPRPGEFEERQEESPLFLAPERPEDRAKWKRLISGDRPKSQGWLQRRMPSDHKTRQRYLTYAVGLLIVVGGALGALIATAVTSGNGDAGAGSVAAADTAADTTVVETAAADTTSRYEQLAASLDTAIASYQGLGGSAPDASPSCDELARRYRLVDDGFVALAAHIRSREDADVTTRMQERFRELLRRVEEVNADFDASGCPRPE